jgi:hypothetical protein
MAERWHSNEKSMKWCCKVFEGWFQNAGKRGLGVFATNGNSEIAFILQFRALDPEVPSPLSTSPFSSVSDVHIHFCPWCGANLRKTYGDTLRELDRSELRVRLLRE